MESSRFARRVLAQGGFAGVPGLELQDIPSLHTLGLQADTKLVQSGTEASAWAELGRACRASCPTGLPKLAASAMTSRMSSATW